MRILDKQRDRVKALGLALVLVSVVFLMLNQVVHGGGATMGVSPAAYMPQQAEISGGMLPAQAGVSGAFQPALATPTPIPTPIPTPKPTVAPPRQAQARALAASSGGGFIWPAQGSITSYFGPGHPLGIDIGAPFGAPVCASASGEVIFAGGQACCSYGLYVIVAHGNGLSTLYGHLSGLPVGVGDWLAQGDVLGYVGLTGKTFGAHLHFEIRLGGVHVNPLAYLP